MTDLIQVQADARACANPECENPMVEPDTDGEVSYFECEMCGFAFGYQKLPGMRIEGSCALGVPEQVRKAASAPYEKAVRSAQGEQSTKPVYLGATIGRRPV